MLDSKKLKGLKSVLFICMGNICRSPTAEAVFRRKAADKGLNLEIDSAGTLGAHEGEEPDHRAQQSGMARGYSFDKIKARKVIVRDFEKYDLILAMDNNNIRELIKIAPEHLQGKIHLFLDFSKSYDEQEVPDPYYGGAKGFQYVVDLIEDASDGLLKVLV